MNRTSRIASLFLLGSAAIIVPPILSSRAESSRAARRVEISQQSPGVCPSGSCRGQSDLIPSDTLTDFSAQPDLSTLSRSNPATAETSRSTTLGELVSPKALVSGRMPVPESLESVEVYLAKNGDLMLGSLPNFSSPYAGKLASMSAGKQVALYTLNPELQKLATDIVKRADAPHVAIVAMEPSSGKILAMAQKSATVPNLALHAGFPAASLFKVVTTTATLERTKLQPDSVVRFRGGTYVLERWNYLPDPRRDRNFMTIREALARSCNAVFGRIALASLNADLLRNYARSFGFNQPIRFERPLPVSSAEIPSDSYQLSRAAAGFGEVNISPIHAAVFMSGVANNGIMPRPIMVDRVVSPSGNTLYQSKPEMMQRMMQSATAKEVLEMMESTTTEGTSKKDFMSKNRPVLGDIRVAAKTGTLRGDNPVGLNHWFIAAAPSTAPKIAISVIVVDPRSSKYRAGKIGRMMIEKYLKG